MGDKKIYIVAKIFDRPGSLAYLCKTPNEARCLPGTLEEKPRSHCAAMALWLLRSTAQICANWLNPLQIQGFFFDGQQTPTSGLSPTKLSPAKSLQHKDLRIWAHVGIQQISSGGIHT